MNWLILGLIFSLVYALSLFQQIKITLKEKGHDVGYFTGWLRDFQAFKELMEKEEDSKKKIDYQKVISGIYFALGGAGVIFILLAMQKMK